MPHAKATLENIGSWAKRRGFIFQTSDIYGGLASNYDYGPYGVLLKNNIRDLWWKQFVTARPDMIGLDGSILMQKQVWEASGHVENFTDPLVEDKVTNKRYRADHLIEAYLHKHEIEDVDVSSMTLEQMGEAIEKYGIKSPDGNPVNQPRRFNLMFDTKAGATAGDDATIYLRPETAQAIFVNFKNILDTMRVRLPFGIAQIGKAFRNEITKGQFIFRTIETEQMEIEYFIRPDAEWEKMMDEWLEQMRSFYVQIGAKEEDLRFREHSPEELSHYSKKTYDPEYHFDFGWKEIAGLAHRQDFDLTQHIKHSKAKLEYRDPVTNEVFVPHVLEPSFGLARALLVSLYAAYTEETLENGSTRTVMKFPKDIAPIKLAIFPLQKDENLQVKAQDLYKNFLGKISVEFDNSGNIGKMYRRQDEIGTPYCVTVDYQTLEDNTVTVRDRDTMEQNRVSINDLADFLGYRM